MLELDWDAHVDKKLLEQMESDKKNIEEAVKNYKDPSDIDSLQSLCIEANATINLVAGDDVDAYELFRYKLFETQEGSAFIVQGIERETDVRFTSGPDIGED